MGKDSADKAATKTFSGDVVAALLMPFNCTSVTMKQYEMMSSLDGKKSASAFQHDFRCVLAKAKELKAQVDGDQGFKPVDNSGKKPGPKRKADSDEDALATPPNSAKKPKTAPVPKPRGRPAKKATSNGSDATSPPANNLHGGDETYDEYFSSLIKTEPDFADGM